MSAGSEGLSKGDLDLIASTLQMSAQFQRMRHTRRCRRCGSWLAVDQPSLDTCSLSREEKP